MARTDDETEIRFSGPFANALVPMSVGMARQLMLAAALLFFIGSFSGMPYLLGWSELPGSNREGMSFAGIAGFLTSLLLFLLRRTDAATLGRFYATVTMVGFASSTFTLASVVVNAGPQFEGSLVFFAATPLLAFFALRTWWAVGVTLFGIAGLVGGLVILDGPTAPEQQIVNVIAASVTAGVLVGGIGRRLEDARRREREANSKLDLLNGRLRRFVDRQVADAMADEEDRLTPHRADIAAFFVDLRGFTAYTNSAEPDRVVGVLAEYYAAVGTVVEQHGGTIGGFDGDGVFAFVGDPVPSDNPAAAAVAMAKDVARALDALVDGWGELGYGIGVAYGEATVGLVGFEGRIDYTPVGACVNLAARLCSDAKHGEIVVDDALKKAAKLKGVRKRPSAELKGFGAVTTYRLNR